MGNWFFHYVMVSFPRNRTEACAVGFQLVREEGAAKLA